MFVLPFNYEVGEGGNEDEDQGHDNLGDLPLEMGVDDEEGGEEEADDVAHSSIAGPQCNQCPVLLIGAVIVDQDERDGPVVHLEEPKEEQQDYCDCPCILGGEQVGD